MKKDKRTSYMQSRFPRIPDDYYPTLDTRCVDGLLTHFHLWNAPIIDMCSPSGSRIVDYLNSRGYDAHGVGDAFATTLYTGGGRALPFGVTNPPYKRSLVDPIVKRQIERVQKGELKLCAFLLRTAFDHAMTRQDIFANHPHYWGQIKLLFRPWWVESREHVPFHHHVWHVWINEPRYTPFPAVAYYDVPYDPQYVADRKSKKKRK